MATITMATQPTKPLSRVERTKSFLRASLLKKWKSSKELFTRPLATFTNRNEQVKLSRKHFDDKNQSNEYVNRKVFDTLDEFERNFLLSAGRKILVRELRKNFEKPQESAPQNNKIVAVIVTNEANTQNDKTKKYSDACVQTTPNTDDWENDYQPLRFEQQPPPPPKKKNPTLISRHSFYNTYRNEYYPVQDNHYASNLSLLSCGASSQREKTLEKTINKYKNSMRSSSAVDLTSLSTFIYETPTTQNAIHQSERLHYSSIINITNSTNDLTSLPAIVDYRLKDERKSHLKQTNSMKCVNMEPIIRFRNTDDDTKSMIIPNSTCDLLNGDNRQTKNADVNGSNVSLFSVNTVNNEPIYINWNNANATHKNSNGSANTNYKHDGNNNNMTNSLTQTQQTTKIRKCYSINQIDLNLLKNELDEYIDRELRTTNFGRNTLAHRRLQLENRLKKELDLEQKIDLEIKMREGSAKLLAACNNPKAIGYTGNLSSAQNTQILEAAKNLLTSNERMTAYMAELQRRKRDRCEPVKLSSATKATAKVSLSEIRMPLMWRDIDHFKNKGDHRRFAVFCLVRIGTDIFDTSLLCPVDRSLTDISFNDVILFSNVEPDFELKLEVYAVMMETDLTIASTPRKIKNTIHSSISRTVGKRLASTLKDELNNTKIGPKFELIATATLCLGETSDLPHTHDLQLISNTSNFPSNNINNNSNQLNNKLPLFGHFCCRLAIQPDFMKANYFAGNLQMIFPRNGQLFDGYARLQAFKISLWNDQRSFENGDCASYAIDVTRDTKTKRKSDVELYVCNMEEGAMMKYVFHAKETIEIANFELAIKRAIREHLQWKHVTLTSPMQLTTPGTEKNYFSRSGRHGSLYDQVPVFGSKNSDSTQLNDADSAEKPKGFRSRANSSSSVNTAISGTSVSSMISISSSRRSHWPFGK